MNPPTLFDRPLSHTHDPLPSHLAAERHVGNGKAARHGAIVLDLVRSFPDRTAV